MNNNEEHNKSLTRTVAPSDALLLYISYNVMIINSIIVYHITMNDRAEPQYKGHMRVCEDV